MSISNYLIIVLKCLLCEKITFIIVSVLKELAKSSANQLDDQLVDIIEYSLKSAFHLIGGGGPEKT